MNIYFDRIIWKKRYFEQRLFNFNNFMGFFNNFMVSNDFEIKFCKILIICNDSFYLFFISVTLLAISIFFKFCFKEAKRQLETFNLMT